MIASMLIIVVSLALFLYWFRYTCVLILSTRTTKDFGAEIAEAHRLAFREAADLVESSGPDALAALRASLDRDYKVVSALLRQAGNVTVGGDSLEEIMLRIDYRLMKAWCALTCRFAGSGSRAALREMANIVAHFANLCGERQAGAMKA